MDPSVGIQDMFTTMETTLGLCTMFIKYFASFKKKINIPLDLNELEMYYLNIKYNINKMYGIIK